MDEILSSGFHFSVDTYDQCIGCQVEVTCLDQRSYSGRVYTIDPLTQSVVLLDEGSNRVHLVLRDDIIQMKIVNREVRSSLDPFVLESSSSLENKDKDKGIRLEKIRCFLRSKRIPFEERFDVDESIELIIHNGIVQIRSPYQLTTISGTNPIVLSRFKQLLQSILC